MASARQIAANRRNARRSTGPKTASGRARASRNACRHGLRGTSGTAAWSDEVERLARQIAGGSDAPTITALARSAAEADFDIERVRLTRAGIIAAIEQTLAASAGRPDMESFARVAARLNILNRYERRAAGRRDKAIRALCRHRAASASSMRPASTNEANFRTRARDGAGQSAAALHSFTSCHPGAFAPGRRAARSAMRADPGPMSPGLRNQGEAGVRGSRLSRLEPAPGPLISAFDLFSLRKSVTCRVLVAPPRSHLLVNVGNF
jgi:hypothetical protein